jgi:lysozyme family protein
MADFNICFEKTLMFEGGYKLSNLRNDSGGRTYAGIAENYHKEWPGWEILDMGGTPLPELVQDFYEETFWEPLGLPHVNHDAVAWPIFDFAITSGRMIAIKTAQSIIGVKQDLLIGPITIGALNSVEIDWFKLKYFARRARYYTNIAQKNMTQRFFLASWMDRALAGVCI